MTWAGNHVPIEKVFSVIERQTGYSFFYNEADLRGARKVSAVLNNADLQTVLSEILPGESLKYDIQGRTIFIHAVPENRRITENIPAADTLITVQGRITDAGTGDPLAGVTIKAGKENAGTVTDLSGNYRINVSGNTLLSVSFIGYEAREIPVGERENIDIALTPAISELNQLVVVGYGVQQKKDLTGAINVISSDAIGNVPSANIIQAIQGQGAGIDIVKSGGNSHPGAKPKIRIRGERSLEATNSPLIVVDGIPFDGDINDINPDDVASISVLKDASATAIYGSRGANGVLLLTMKQGKVGKAKVTYNAYSGFTRPYSDYPMMDAGQFTLLKKWARFNAFPGKYENIDDPKLLTDGFFDPQELEGIKTGRSTDWQRLVYKTGFTTNHHLGVSGGTENTRYDISGGYYRETGIYEGQSFERYSLKATVNQQLGNYVKIGLSSINNFAVTNGESFNPMGQALRASPMASPYDTSGNILIGFVPGSATQVWNPLNNFLPDAEMEKRKQLSTFNSFYLEADLFKGLSYRLNAGANVSTYLYGDFYASNTSENRGGLSTAQNKSMLSTNYTVENLLIYHKIFGQNKINFTGLYSLQQATSQTNSFNYNDISADVLQYFEPQYAANLQGSGSYSKWAMISYMGRINYSFADKYLATLTFRSDGSSVLAPQNKYHVFPSAALAWNVTEEPFVRRSSTISNLKLRASYGLVGNSSIDPYQTLGGLKSIEYNYGSTTSIGSYPSNAPNANLTWEYTATMNVGLDFGLFNNRITGSFEAYHQYTHSLLLPQNLPPTSGIPNPILVNVGKTENKGLELTVSTINLGGNGDRSVRWTTDLNLFLNRGKIVELANGIKRDISDGRFVGYPIEVYYDYKKTGIWQNTAKDSADAAGLKQTITGSGSVIGTIRVADTDDNGKINSDDKIILGSPQPKWEGGMTNTIAFRGFDFTAVMFARIGGMIYSELYGDGYLNTFQGVYNNLKVNYWTPENGENYYPKPNSAQTQTPYHDLLGYFSGTYLKIRSLSLGYQLPKPLLSKLGLDNFYIYTTATAPFVLFSPYVNNYHGMDPETDRDLDINTPSNWSMLFGIKLTF